MTSSPYGPCYETAANGIRSERTRLMRWPNQGPSAVPRTPTSGRLIAYLWHRRSGATCANGGLRSGYRQLADTDEVYPDRLKPVGHCPTSGTMVATSLMRSWGGQGAGASPVGPKRRLLVRFRSWQPPGPPESASRLSVHIFREPVGWLVPMVESNTCSAPGTLAPRRQCVPVPLRVVDGSTWPVATAGAG
jgi:hypothetical protein